MNEDAYLTDQERAILDSEEDEVSTEEAETDPVEANPEESHDPSNVAVAGEEAQSENPGVTGEEAEAGTLSTEETEATEEEAQEEVQAVEEVAEEAEPVAASTHPVQFETQDVSGIPEQLKALTEKFDEGEVDLTEYLDQRDKLNKQLYQAEVSESLSAQLSDHQWKLDQQTFFRDNPELSTPAMAGAIGQVYADPKFMEVHGAKTGLEILIEAGKVVRADIMKIAGVTPATKETTKPAQELTADEKRAALKGRGGHADTLPKTLSDAPAASQDSESASKFTHIDQLEGLDKERAVAQLSEADQDAWLSGLH